MYLEYLNKNNSKYNLPKKIKNLFKNSEDHSFCDYFNEATKNYNLTCDDIGSNISNYGISSLLNYFTDNLYYLTFLFKESI